MKKLEQYKIALQAKFVKFKVDQFDVQFVIICFSELPYTFVVKFVR